MREHGSEEPHKREGKFCLSLSFINLVREDKNCTFTKFSELYKYDSFVNFSCISTSVLLCSTA